MADHLRATPGNDARTGVAAGAERWLGRLALGSALIGGAVLTLIAAMTVVSIGGRSVLPWGPIPGDVELVEAGTAFAVFAFLPWCQLVRGHVTVDLVLARAGPRFNAWVDALANGLTTAVGTVLTWRLWLGLLDRARFDETTFILQFPLWWAYAACLPAAMLFVVTAAYTTARSLREASAR